MVQGLDSDHSILPTSLGEVNQLTYQSNWGTHNSHLECLAPIDVELLNLPPCFERDFDKDPEIFTLVAKGLGVTASTEDLDNHERLSREICFKFLIGKCAGQCRRRHLSRDDVIKIVDNALSNMRGPVPLIPFRLLHPIVGIDKAKKYLSIQKTL